MRIVDIVYRYDAVRESGPRPDSPQQAAERLERGNIDFAGLIDSLLDGNDRPASRIVHVDPRDLGVRTDGKTPAQRPFAAVLGCADARVPIELIFNEGPNDLFVVRVAGNVLGREVLGSLHYAVENLGGSLKLLVVLGHSGCGAVAAAVDTFLNPASYLDLATSYPLRGIIDGLLVATHGAARLLDTEHGAGMRTRPGYRGALIECTVALNAALVAHTLERELEANRVPGADEVGVVWTVYAIDTRRAWGPVAEDGGRLGLAQPPADHQGFRDLGRAIVRSDRILSLLDGQRGDRTGGR